MKRVAFLSLLVFAACVAPSKPPVVVPVPAPTPVKAMHVVVRDVLGRTPEHIRGSIGTTAWSSACTPISFAMLSCALPVGVEFGATVSVKFEGDGNDPYLAELPTAPDLNVTLPLSFHPLPQLIPVGRTLRQVDGTHWTAIEASDFNLYNRFLNGEGIEPVLAQRSDAGFTLLRVWTAVNVPGIGRLIPSEHADFYARIPDFLKLTAKYHLYVEFTAFTGPYDGIFNSDDEKVAHWERLKTVTCGQTGVAYLELVNEYDNPPNLGLPFDRLTRPTCPGLLASHGSATQDTLPKQPYWDVLTYRPAGGETWRKSGHNAGELTGFGAPPVISNETQRFPDNDNDPNHAYDMAAGCVLLSMGCAFHSVHGKDSTLWQGDELRDAQAFGAGGHSVPLLCQDLGYENLGDVPGFLRVYRTGGVAACTVSIR
ncbi:MAG TPA: hypothetical protein VF456_17020 [Vicinamibacterales bacterium]